MAVRNGATASATWLNSGLGKRELLSFVSAPRGKGVALVNGEAPSHETRDDADAAYSRVPPALAGPQS